MDRISIKPEDVRVLKEKGRARIRHAHYGVLEMYGPVGNELWVSESWYTTQIPGEKIYVADLEGEVPIGYTYNQARGMKKQEDSRLAVRILSRETEGKFNYLELEVIPKTW